MRFFAMAVTVLSLVGGNARAGAAPETFLYVVNATGLPFRMALDAEKQSPEMAHMVGAMHPMVAGAHRLTGNVLGEAPASTTLDLNEENLAVTSISNIGFWCVVVGRRSTTELVFLRATPPQCGDLVKSAADGSAKR